MYDDPKVSKLYDTQHFRKTAGAAPLSTFRSWYELEFLHYLEASGARRVLDVGCGAGAFYHLLESAYPGKYRYLGIDVSATQIARARGNFGSSLFQIADLDEIEDFSDYDAVHCWSVLSFMSPRKQIDAIKRITASSRTLLDTNFTLPRPDYCPRCFYKRFAEDERLTCVSFPYIFELPTLANHEVFIRPTKYAGTLLVNRNERDCAVALKGERDGWGQRLYKRRWRAPRNALEVRIRPAGWQWSPPSAGAVDGLEIMQQYVKMLQ
jgi:SAM-dependent methyltransferase